MVSSSGKPSSSSRTLYLDNPFKINGKKHKFIKEERKIRHIESTNELGMKNYSITGEIKTKCNVRLGKDASARNIKSEGTVQLKKNSRVDRDIEASKVILSNASEAGSISAENVELSNEATVRDSIKADRVKLKDTVETGVINAMDVKLSGRSYTRLIRSQGKVCLANDSFAQFIEGSGFEYPYLTHDDKLPELVELQDNAHAVGVKAENIRRTNAMSPRA